MMLMNLPEVVGNLRSLGSVEVSELQKPVGVAFWKTVCLEMKQTPDWVVFGVVREE